MQLLERLLTDHHAHERDTSPQAIKQLEQDGCHIAASPNRGLTLQHVGLGVYGDYLRHTTDLSRVVVYQQTASTQDVAKRLIQDLGPQAANTLVIADQQTQGRGRLGRRWIAPPGQVIMCSLIPPPPPPTTAATKPSSSTSTSTDRLSLIASVAIAQAIEPLVQPLGHQLTIKWPNDILINHQKLAGILIETTTTNTTATATHSTQIPSSPIPIIGIGLNVGQTQADWAQLQQDHPNATGSIQTATSLRALGSPAKRLHVLANLINQLNQNLNRPDADLVNAWRQRCAWLGTPQTFIHNGQEIQGTVTDLDPDLGLIIRTHQGSYRHLPAATTSTV